MYSTHFFKSCWLYVTNNNIHQIEISAVISTWKHRLIFGTDVKQHKGRIGMSWVFTTLKYKALFFEWEFKHVSALYIKHVKNQMAHSKRRIVHLACYIWNIWSLRYGVIYQPKPELIETRMMYVVILTSFTFPVIWFVPRISILT